MKRTIATLALIALPLGVLSQQQGKVSLVHPKSSVLIVKEVKKSNDVEAAFGGSQWITGTMYGRWPAGVLALNYKEPDVFIVPDRQSAALLPHFTIRHDTGVNRYQVRSVDMVNPMQALRLAVTEDQYRRLMERRVNHVRATGRFLIDRYVVGVECDGPWARARLIEAELPEQLASMHRSAPETC